MRLEINSVNRNITEAWYVKGSITSPRIWTNHRVSWQKSSCESFNWPNSLNCVDQSQPELVKHNIFIIPSTVLIMEIIFTTNKQIICIIVLTLLGLDNNANYLLLCGDNNFHSIQIATNQPCQ